MPRFRLRLIRVNYALAAAVAAFASIAIIVRFAEVERGEPVRCPPGLTAQAARCCGTGQVLATSEQCRGRATSCAAGMTIDPAGNCLLPGERVPIAAGSVRFGATDWQGIPDPSREVSVAAFELDRAEVTVERFRACSDAGKCPQLPVGSEPGRPVRNVSPSEAQAFCAFAGGHLPSSDEWLFAAAGTAGRRYPWGNTGLVCRRAAFGLLRGPCAQGGSSPELAGARPDGATPEGIVDLSGNVAEWTREPDGSFVARGGSFRSELASELKTTAFEARATRAAYVGFRCAYGAARTANYNASHLNGP